MKQYIIVGILAIVVLIFAFSRWKKKYGHKNRPAKGRTIASKKADFITQCYDIADGKADYPANIRKEPKFIATETKGTGSNKAKKVTKRTSG